MLEKTPDSPLDYKEIQPVHLKGDQYWMFIEETDAEAETPILWPPDEKNWLVWKDSSNNTREDSTHGHHQMVNTEIRLIIFFAAKDGEALYSQQK